MLYDRVEIEVAGGAGGNGCVSFRREAHVAKGGPDGGNGGRGGDVTVVADPALRDLSYFRHKRQFRGGRGGHGEGAMRHGADGESVELKVAVGTVVESSEGVLYDLAKPGQRVVVASGGSGGYGNKRFANATRQAPRFAQQGLPGKRVVLKLRLKLLADVGLVGKPNAGKSSLLRALTKARPKIADYPFTTLEPVLGTVEQEGEQLIIADIPGLIEGASEGTGLGHEFLAHVERTRLLVHVVELVTLDGSDPLDNYCSVEEELFLHNRELATRPRIVVLNKRDLIVDAEAEQAHSRWCSELGEGREILLASAVDGRGIDQLTWAIFKGYAVAPKAELAPQDSETQGQPASYKVYRPGAEERFEVVRSGDGSFTVTGSAVDRLVQRTDPENEEALDYLEQRLRKLGVVEALELKGFNSGDEVVVGGRSFELFL